VLICVTLNAINAGIFFTAAASFLTEDWTQVVFIDRCADSPSHIRACLLIGSEVNPAINPRIGDVVCDLLKRVVMQDDVG
jgi:hypothetical protein